MKQARVTPLILACLPLHFWDLAMFPEFLSGTGTPSDSWDDLWECAVIPPVELIYVQFYLPPHLDISRVIITTLYMPVHSARRHIHQAPVTGYSFINDQIHFCGITALWCMGRRADAGQTDTQACTPLSLCCVVVSVVDDDGVASHTTTSNKRSGRIKTWGRSRFRRQTQRQTGGGMDWTFLSSAGRRVLC